MRRSIQLFLITCLLALGAAACPTFQPKTACTSDQDCFAGYRCDLDDSQECMPSCDKDTDCIASKTCIQSAGANSGGVCRYGSRTGDTAGGDPAGGDPVGGD